MWGRPSGRLTAIINVRQGGCKSFPSGAHEALPARLVVVVVVVLVAAVVVVGVALLEPELRARPLPSPEVRVDRASLAGTKIRCEFGTKTSVEFK